MARTSADQTKHALRRALRERRGAAEPATGDADRLADLVLAVAGPVGSLAAYVSLPTEPPTGELLGRCRSRGRRVLLPVLLPDLDLDWAPDDGGYRPGSGPGVLEPGTPRLGVEAVASVALVVVPALAVDRRGVRLGQGGGSYDRALARVPGSTLVVALLQPGELVDVLPRADHDRPVDAVITTAGVVRLP